MEKSGKEPDIFKKAEDFLRIFRKGEEFTHELIKENERLRYKIVKVEEENKMILKELNSSDVEKLKKTIHQLEQEKLAVIDRFKEVEEENKDFASKYIEVEEENNNLANLYVASYQLHSTLDFDEVLRIVLEIIINLIGAEKFAIMLLKEETDELIVVASEGMDGTGFKMVKVGNGIIGNVAQTGDSYFEEDIDNFHPSYDLHPIACIPLKIKEHIIGVIPIFSLLEHKKRFTKIDYELFSMLAGHAATAIFSSRLYFQSERKLSTIQGFLDLLSGKKI
ncbi:MAG: GAF domain-containing protein [Nitrospirota bacterium]